MYDPASKSVYCERCMKQIETKSKPFKNGDVSQINKELKRQGWIAERNLHLCPSCSP